MRKLELKDTWGDKLEVWKDLGGTVWMRAVAFDSLDGEEDVVLEFHPAAIKALRKYLKGV